MNSYSDYFMFSLWLNSPYLTLAVPRAPVAHKYLPVGPMGSGIAQESPHGKGAFDLMHQCTHSINPMDLLRPTSTSEWAQTSGAHGTGRDVIILWQILLLFLPLSWAWSSAWPFLYPLLPTPHLPPLQEDLPLGSARGVVAGCPHGTESQCQLALSQCWQLLPQMLQMFLTAEVLNLFWPWPGTVGKKFPRTSWAVHAHFMLVRSELRMLSPVAGMCIPSLLQSRGKLGMSSPAGGLRVPSLHRG